MNDLNSDTRKQAFSSNGRYFGIAVHSFQSLRVIFYSPLLGNYSNRKCSGTTQQN